MPEIESSKPKGHIQIDGRCTRLDTAQRMPTFRLASKQSVAWLLSCLMFEDRQSAFIECRAAKCTRRKMWLPGVTTLIPFEIAFNDMDRILFIRYFECHPHKTKREKIINFAVLQHSQTLNQKNVLTQEKFNFSFRKPILYLHGTNFSPLASFIGVLCIENFRKQTFIITLIGCSSII